VTRARGRRDRRRVRSGISSPVPTALRAQPPELVEVPADEPASAPDREAEARLEAETPGVAAVPKRKEGRRDWRAHPRPRGGEPPPEPQFVRPVPEVERAGSPGSP
jgi:hypothetical protein